MTTAVIVDIVRTRSHARAAATADSGGFDREIIPVRLPDGSSHTADETDAGSVMASLQAAISPPS